MLFGDFNFTVGINNYFCAAGLRCCGGLRLRVCFVSGQSDCLFEEALALNNAWMYFDKADKISPGFFFPILQCHMIRVT